MSTPGMYPDLGRLTPTTAVDPMATYLTERERVNLGLEDAPTDEGYIVIDIPNTGPGHVVTLPAPVVANPPAIRTATPMAPGTATTTPLPPSPFNFASSYSSRAYTVR